MQEIKTLDALNDVMDKEKWAPPTYTSPEGYDAYYDCGCGENMYCLKVIMST